MATQELSEGISVYVLSYKYAHLAGHAVDSVKSQTRKPEKLVLVDDGGNDGVDKVAEKMGVEYLHWENKGIAGTFQACIDHCTTKKMMFLGADNWLRPDTLELLGRVKADIVTYDVACCGELVDKWINGSMDISDWHGYKRWRLYKGNNIQEDNDIHGSALFNTELAKQVACRGNTYNGGCVDWELWKDLDKLGATVGYVSEPLLFYRRHKDNFSKI